MDWVHCNKCFIQPGEVAGKKFSITNCGHIFCAECLKSLPDCHVCHSKYNTIPLASKMSPDVEAYFLDPIQNIQKQVKILEFQQQHRTRLAAYKKGKLTNYNNLKTEYAAVKEEIKKVEKEIAILKDEINKKKEEVNHYKIKCEKLIRYVQSQRHASPSSNIFSQSSTPINSQPRKSPMFSAGSEILSDVHNSARRVSRPTNFFIMSDASQKTDKMFATPSAPLKFGGDYRNTVNVTPYGSSPLSPDSIPSGYNQKDPLQRKVKMPGDRGGPSPATKIGLHRLNISRPSPTLSKEKPTFNKYSQYF